MPAEATATLDDVIRELQALRDAVGREPSLLLDMAGVVALSGLSKSSVYRSLAGGGFPKPCDTPSGPRWRRSDVLKWIERLKPARGRSAKSALLSTT
jgi:predicted DNA-binding transcriptional regulator AlpA